MANRNETEGRFDNTPNLIMKGAKIIFRNFRGKDYGYNPNHKRTFSILLDPDETDIEAMREDGWNVKPIKPREGYEDEPQMFKLEVEVRWDKYPPSIWQITSNGEDENGNKKYSRTKMDEESVGTFDTAEIVNVNVEISHGKTYSCNGKVGIKAYVRKMQIEVVQDEFDSFYDFDDEDDVF